MPPMFKIAALVSAPKDLCSSFSYRQLVQAVILAFKQPEELEVCFWLADKDCGWAITKEAIALLRGAIAEPNTSMCRVFGCNLSE